MAVAEKRERISREKGKRGEEAGTTGSSKVKAGWAMWMVDTNREKSAHLVR